MNVRVTVYAAVIAALAWTAPAAAQNSGASADSKTLTYIRGQSVMPIFHGWMKNDDGTYDLYFSYLNRNWQEELDIPVGADNNISAPFGPDGGQPTHFFPRMNRWQFSVRVPKDFGSKEVVWTLTAHGETHRAYATLNPGYEVDDFLIMHEFANSERGRKPPTVKVEGEKQRTVKVGQATQLVAIAGSPDSPIGGQPPAARGGRAAGAGGRRGRGPGPPSPGELLAGDVGGDFTRSTARGLRLAWYVYRGNADNVNFDPPMAFKVWEDQRGGSPWSPGFRTPPVPPGNKWTYNVTFDKPGTYVLRAQAHDGYQFANENITFVVTQ